MKNSGAVAELGPKAKPAADSGAIRDRKPLRIGNFAFASKLVCAKIEEEVKPNEKQEE